VCCVLIGVSPYLVPLPPGDDPIAVTVIIIIIIIIIFKKIIILIVTPTTAKLSKRNSKAIPVTSHRGSIGL
jgi:hypothetical protein